MLWISLAVIAQILQAGGTYIDKYVLVVKNGINHPSAYAFFTAALSGVIVIILPFGLVTWPTFEVAFLSLCSSMLYVASLLFLYRSIRKLSVTDVMPITASTAAITVALLASLWLAEDLPISLLPAFALLVLGTFLIYCFCFPWSMFFMTVAAGVLGGASTFLLKIIFQTTTFGNALFWPLFMNVLVACILLAPVRWKSIRDTMRDSSGGSKGLAILSKSCAGIAFLFIFLAISLKGSSVTVINALNGLELVFVLLFAYIFAHRIPHVFQAETRRDTITLKVIGTIAIVVGLALLFVSGTTLT